MKRSAVVAPAVAYLLVIVILVGTIGVVTSAFRSSPSVTSGLSVSTSASIPSESTFLVQVVNESTRSPISGVDVEAGPAASPNDLIFTPGGPMLAECVHEVPNGAVIGNGTVVSNGTTSTFTPCAQKVYVTNASGWVSITNATGGWYFIKAGNVNMWNDVVMGVIPNNTVNMAIPLPAGNITVPASETSCSYGSFANMTNGCKSVPGTPVLWPATSIVLPCGVGVPSGSAVTAQGFYGGYYIAYAFANFPNGTKAALPNETDCGVGSL